jgi:hypothetical protein
MEYIAGLDKTSRRDAAAAADRCAKIGRGILAGAGYFLTAFPEQSL